MSILDTFTILFNSNADEVEKGADKAIDAGRKLEEQLGGTGEAGAAASAEIVSGNEEVAASFTDIMNAMKEGFDETFAAEVAKAQEQLGGSVAATTEKTKEQGEAAKEAGHKGKEAAEKVEKENSKLAESFDKIKEHAHESFEHILEQVGEVIAAYKIWFGIEHGVENFFEQAEISENLGHTAAMLDVNTEALDAWGHIVKLAGGSAEAFQGSLENLQFGLERLALTGHSRALPFFQKLGIDVHDANGKIKNAFDLLPELADKIQKLPRPESGAILRGMGFDKSTIFVLQQGKKEIDELLERQKKLGVTTKEDTEVAEKFNDEWLDIKQLFTSIVIAADTMFMPFLYDLLKIVEDIIFFLKDHKDLAVGFLIALGAGALYAAYAFGLLDAAIAILTSPITAIVVAIGALITLFAFLYDDIINFAEGNNSVIGELAKRWPIVGEAVHGLIAIFKEAKEAAIEFLSEVWEWIKRIPEGFKAWGEVFDFISEKIKAFGEYVSSIFEGMPEPFKAAMNTYVAIAKDMWSILVSSFKIGVEEINVFVNAIFEVMKALLNLIGDLIVNPKHAFQNFGEAIMKIVEGIVGVFPHLTEAFAEVGASFSDIGRKLIDLWHEIGGVIGGVVDKVGGAIGTVGKWLNKAGGMVAHPGAWIAGENPDLVTGQEHLAATNSPLMAQTPQSIAAGGNQNKETNNNVTVNAPTTINTQSTDPAGIKQEFDRHLDSHLDDAINHYADGVSY